MILEFCHVTGTSKKYALHISMTGGDEYDFLVTDKIFVTCESKPERSLKVSIK